MSNSHFMLIGWVIWSLLLGSALWNFTQGDKAMVLVTLGMVVVMTIALVGVKR